VTPKPLVATEKQVLLQKAQVFMATEVVLVVMMVALQVTTQDPLHQNF
jgi:hypothetical protein